MDLERKRIKILLLVSFILCLQGVKSTCTADTAVEFDAIDPTNYDKNYSSITAVGKRPYGFQKATWYYNDASRPNPCFKVTNVTNRKVEVMVETIPKARLCVKAQGTKILGCADGGTGQMYNCKLALGDTAYFEFYCDQRCGEHNVQFWFRIVKGLSPAEDREDQYCETRSQDEYPENLRQLPPGFDFPIETTTVIGDASSLHKTHYIILSIMIGAFISIFV